MLHTAGSTSFVAGLMLCQPAVTYQNFVVDEHVLLATNTDRTTQQMPRLEPLTLAQLKTHVSVLKKNFTTDTGVFHPTSGTCRAFKAQYLQARAQFLRGGVGQAAGPVGV